MKKKIILIAVICISASRKIGISLHSTFLFFLICTFTHLPICTFAQVANGTGAGNCLSFNGTSDYVQVNGYSALPYPKTFSFWFYANNTSPSSYFPFVRENEGSLIRTGSGGNTIEIWTYLGSGSPDFNYESNMTFNVNQWTHVAVVLTSNTNGFLYINGVQESFSIPVSGPAGTGGDSNFQIAKGDGRYFPGKIDEVRIYNYALTQDEIRATMCKKLTGNETGLVGYWRFDEGSGGTAFDASPNGNDGTLH